MMKKLLLIVVALFCWGVAAHAQVFFQNTMYQYAQFAYNPASAGVSGPGLIEGANISFLGRLQWLGFEGAPQTSALSFHSPLKAGYGAAGILAIADQIGPFSNVYLQGAYGYDFGLFDDNLTLRIGVGGGIRQISLDPSGFLAPDDGDVVITGSQQSTIVEALSAGIYLTGFDERLFVSLAGQNLTDPSIDAITGGIDRDNVASIGSRTFTAAAGYTFNLNDKMTLQPSAMMITDFSQTPQLNMSLIWGYSPLLVGLNYRGNLAAESIGGIIGVNLSGNTFLGYSYDFPLSDLNNNTDINTHEVILSYTFSDLFGSNRSRDQDDPIKNGGIGL
jgi:type IX secretion system PorP/SprF family membrane protein